MDNEEIWSVTFFPFELLVLNCKAQNENNIFVIKYDWKL